MKSKTLIRRLYDLGSRFEISSERAIANLARKLMKK